MSTVTAASLPLTFEDGTKYQFSPLTDKDIDEIDEWMRQKVLQSARMMLEPGMSQRERDEILGAAMRTASETSMLSPSGHRMISTLHGMVRVCWQSVKKLHPDVTEDELRKQLVNARNMQSLNDLFDQANGVPGRLKGKNSKNRKRVKR